MDGKLEHDQVHGLVTRTGFTIIITQRKKASRAVLLHAKCIYDTTIDRVIPGHIQCFHFWMSPVHTCDTNLYVTDATAG